MGKANFSPAEWASLNEAFALAKSSLGSSDLALRNLHGHMLGDRLPSAVWRVERDGTEVFEKLKSSSWEVRTLQEGFAPGPDPNGPLRRSGMVKVHDRGALYSRARHWYFVSRRHLDKLYAVAVQADDVVTPRAKSGPKPTDDWPLEVASWLVWKAVEYPNELHNVDALVGEVRKFLGDEGIFLPKDAKEVRKVLVRLLIYVRR